MAMSGIGCDSEVTELAEKFNTGGKGLNGAIFAFSSDHKKIILQEKIGKDCTSPFQEIMKKMPKNDVRYAVIDVQIKDAEKNTSKLVLCMWAPDTTSVKQKMLATSSMKSMEKVFNKCSAKLELNDDDVVDTLVSQLTKSGSTKQIEEIEGRKIVQNGNTWDFVKDKKDVKKDDD